MEQTLRELVNAAADAAQQVPRQEMKITGKHQGVTKAYQRTPSPEAKSVIDFILRNKVSGCRC